MTTIVWFLSSCRRNIINGCNPFPSWPSAAPDTYFYSKSTSRVTTFKQNWSIIFGLPLTKYVFWVFLSNRAIKIVTQMYRVICTSALLSKLLERFSIECRKTKTKEITLTNHNSRKQSYEPIRARRKYMSPVPSAGKRVRVSHDWFYFWLGQGSGARFFNQSQSVTMQNQSQLRNYFRHSIEKRSIVHVKNKSVWLVKGNTCCHIIRRLKKVGFTDQKQIHTFLRPVLWAHRYTSKSCDVRKLLEK